MDDIYHFGRLDILDSLLDYRTEASNCETNGRLVRLPISSGDVAGRLQKGVWQPEVKTDVHVA